MFGEFHNIFLIFIIIMIKVRAQYYLCFGTEESECFFIIFGCLNYVIPISSKLVVYKTVEAPRGTLIHHYKVDKYGKITWVNMIIATENNNLAYNQAVTQVAKRYVNSAKLTEGMLNRVEAVIRAFDPCLSCATHAWGEMPLSIQLYDSDGKLVDKVVRM